MITCIVLGRVFLVLVLFLSLAWDKIDEHRGADVKYCDPRLWGIEHSQRILVGKDRAYLADPDGMEKLVTEEEQRRQEVRQTQERLEENQKEIRELEDKKKANGTPGPLMQHRR